MTCSIPKGWLLHRRVWQQTPSVWQQTSSRSGNRQFFFCSSLYDWGSGNLLSSQLAHSLQLQPDLILTWGWGITTVTLLRWWIWVSMTCSIPWLVRGSRKLWALTFTSLFVISLTSNNRQTKGWLLHRRVWQQTLTYASGNRQAVGLETDK